MNIKNKTELENLINETQRDNPAKTSFDIYQCIKKHNFIVKENFKPYIKYFEDYFDVLNDIISSLNFVPKENWPQYKGLQFLMFPETLKTLHRAFEDTLDGYYEEAIMLLRSVYESYIRMIFVACYPKDYEAIFIKRKHKRNLNITNFVKDELRFDWEFIYRFTSCIAHAKIYPIAERWIQLSKGKDKYPISLEYKYDKDGISRPMNLSTFLLYVLVNITLAIFKEDLSNSKIDQNDVARIEKIDKALRGIVESLPNKFSTTITDIDKINKIIEEVKKGEDWKKIT
jgi:hypothetical protein